MTDEPAGTDASLVAATQPQFQPLRRGQQASDAFYFGVLGIWIGAYLVMGIAAGMVFKVARDLQVTIGVPPWELPVMAELAQSDVLAGYQFGLIFNAAAGVMTVLGMLMLAAYGIRFTRGHWHGFGRWGAGLVLLIAVLFFGVSRFQGRQVFELRGAYYHAVQTQADNTVQIKARFDEAHAASSSAGKASLALLVVLFGVSMVPGKKQAAKEPSTS